MSRQPHWFRTWTESPLRVASQRSNQLGQRVRPAGEKLAGRLDCHIPPFLNGTRHHALCGNPPFSPGQRETWQSVGSEWTINALSFTQACGRAPNIISRQPHWFRTWTESPLRVASQRSNQLGQRVRPAGEKLAGRLDCHTGKKQVHRREMDNEPTVAFYSWCISG